MIFNYDANKTHFQNKGFALTLVLRVLQSLSHNKSHNGIVQNSVPLSSSRKYPYPPPPAPTGTEIPELAHRGFFSKGSDEDWGVTNKFVCFGDFVLVLSAVTLIWWFRFGCYGRYGRFVSLFRVSVHTSDPGTWVDSPGEGTKVNFCWVCAAGLSEPLSHYSLFCGQL